MAVIAFEGTSTGNVYEVGHYYQSGNGDVKRANADGTFTNTRTGQVTVGSSQSSTARFYSDNSGSGGGNAGGGSSSAGRPRSVSAAGGKTASEPFTGSGPGSLPAAATGIRPGWTQGAPDKVSDVFISGWRVPIDESTSDAQDVENRFGESDFLSPGWFAQWVRTAPEIASIVNSTIDASGPAPRFVQPEQLDGWLRAQDQQMQQVISDSAGMLPPPVGLPSALP